MPCWPARGAPSCSGRCAPASPRPRRSRAALRTCTSCWPIGAPDAGEAPPGVEAVPGRDDPELLAGADLLVKSPGVPEEAAIVRAARSAGIPVWAEVELAYRLLEERNPIVGITGTNGKTTTTLLTAAMLERGGVPCASAGNVGTALSSLAGRIEPGRPIVCELSSFQLEGVEQFRSDVAVLLNVTPDHLDRHGSFEPYAAAKLRVFERQRESDTADPLRRRRLRRRARRRRPARQRPAGARLGHGARTVRGGLRGLAPARPAQPRQHGLRDRRRARARRRRGRRSALRCASSPRRRTGSSRCASCAACATSTTPRRPTSRPRCRRSRRSTRRCT